MADLIERQSAIDECNKDGAYGYIDAYGLSQLPSAQPDLQPTCNQLATDCISRQAAIDAVTELVSSMSVCLSIDECHGMKRMQGMVVRALDNMPSAQPEPQWIPCSERLPEELEEVNVTWVNHKPEPYYDFVKDKPFTASAVYYKDDWYWYSSVCTDLLAERGENEIDKIDDAIEITAWMPLPEPWKGEDDEL